MGEPIKVYDADGKEIILHGRAYADSLIAAGVVFEQPPSAKAGKVEAVVVSVEPTNPAAPVLKRTAAKRRTGEL